jgi:hypothetical protein
MVKTGLAGLTSDSFPMPSDEHFSMEYYIKLMSYEESTNDFVEIHKYCSKMISMAK